MNVSKLPSIPPSPIPKPPHLQHHHMLTCFGRHNCDMQQKNPLLLPSVTLILHLQRHPDFGRQCDMQQTQLHPKPNVNYHEPCMPRRPKRISMWRSQVCRPTSDVQQNPTWTIDWFVVPESLKCRWVFSAEEFHVNILQTDPKTVGRNFSTEEPHLRNITSLER